MKGSFWLGLLYGDINEHEKELIDKIKYLDWLLSENDGKFSAQNHILLHYNIFVIKSCFESVFEKAYCFQTWYQKGPTALLEHEFYSPKALT